MAWTKSPKGLVDLFALSLPEAPGVQRRQMFGCPCAFVNGNLFAGLFQDEAMARLPPGVREALNGEFGVRPFEPMAGRPMRAYTVLPEQILEDEGRFCEVLRAAWAFTASLPPKLPKAARPKARGSTADSPRSRGRG